MTPLRNALSARAYRTITELCDAFEAAGDEGSADRMRDALGYLWQHRLPEWEKRKLDPEYREQTRRAVVWPMRGYR